MGAEGDTGVAGMGTGTLLTKVQPQSTQAGWGGDSNAFHQQSPETIGQVLSQVWDAFRSSSH